MAKLRINGFRRIAKMNKTDEFSAQTLDGVSVTLRVMETDTEKFFLIGSRFQAVGYTDSVYDAFNFFNNIVPICDYAELYNEGRKF